MAVDVASGVRTDSGFKAGTGDQAAWAFSAKITDAQGVDVSDAYAASGSARYKIAIPNKPSTAELQTDGVNALLMYVPQAIESASFKVVIRDVSCCMVFGSKSPKCGDLALDIAGNYDASHEYNYVIAKGNREIQKDAYSRKPI